MGKIISLAITIAFCAILENHARGVIRQEVKNAMDPDFETKRAEKHVEQRIQVYARVERCLDWVRKSFKRFRKVPAETA